MMGPLGLKNAGVSRPIVGLGLPLICGIAAGISLGSASWLLVGALALISGYIFINLPAKADIFGGIRLETLVLILLFIIGVVRVQVSMTENSALIKEVGKSVEITGLIKSVRAVENGVVLTVAVSEVKGSKLTTAEKTLIRVNNFAASNQNEIIDNNTAKISPDPLTNKTMYGKNVAEKYEYGQIIEVYGKVENIQENGNPGSFSYRDYLRRSGIYTQVKGLATPNIVGRGGNPVGHGAASVREKARQLSGRVMGVREGAVLRGVLYGDTEGMEPTDKEVFSTTGVLHAFAVSGSNVAFVLFLGLFTFGFMPRIPRVVLTGALILFYTVLSGSGGPVVRAAVMGIVVLVGYGLGRKGDGLNSLVFAAVLMLIYDPNYLADPGFQLSFAATWGLIELVPVLRQIGSKNNILSTNNQAKRQKRSLAQKISAVLKEFSLIPLAAQIATLPLLAYYFSQIALVGIAANILVTWFLAIILEIGLVGVGLGMVIPIVGEFLLQPLGYLIKFTLWVLAVMAELPGAAYWVTSPPAWLLCAYYTALVALVHNQGITDKANQVLSWFDQLFNASKSKRGKKLISHRYYLTQIECNKLVTTCIVFGVTIVLSLVIISLPLKKDLKVEFLDVGQGDSILVSTPRGKHFLIDGGPRGESFDTGKSIIIPYLLNRGIKKLEGVFLTHPHDDHSGGLVATVSQIPVGQLFYSPMEANKDSNHSLQLEKKGVEMKIPAYRLKAGMILNMDENLRLQVLSPSELFVGTRSDANNNSLVMLLSYGERSFLLTGDAEIEALSALESYFTFRPDIVKVPHHGSKYALEKELFDNMQPVASIVSVGKNNFGQPAPNVKAYWEERGIPLLRTDQDGMIEVSSDGKNLKVFAGRNHRLLINLD